MYFNIVPDTFAARRAAQFRLAWIWPRTIANREG